MNLIFFRLFLEATRLARRSLNSYKLRSLLTMLGISIGIFSITFVFTLVKTLETAVTKDLESLGNTVMYVHNWPWRDNSQDWFKFFNRPKVSYADYQTLKNNLDNIDGVALSISRRNATVRAGGFSTEGVVIEGVTFEFNRINTFDMESGRYFSPIEVEVGRPVCLVGVKVAENLFQTTEVEGRFITVRGRRLTIIGVIERQGSALFGPSRDEEVIIPFTLFAQMYNTNSRGIDKVISIRANSYEKLPEVEAETIGLIRQARGLAPWKEDNFSINKQEMLLTGIQGVFDALRTAGIIISIFAMLIGGVGIANIMFVSVKERTVEIGVQKALGAKKWFIQVQFLVEAVILCVFGGIIGMALMLLGAGVAQLGIDAAELGITVAVSYGGLMTGLIFSVVVGIVAGFLPAQPRPRRGHAPVNAHVRVASPGFSGSSSNSTSESAKRDRSLLRTSRGARGCTVAFRSGAT